MSFFINFDTLIRGCGTGKHVRYNTNHTVRQVKDAHFLVFPGTFKSLLQDFVFIYIYDYQNAKWKCSTLTIRVLCPFLDTSYLLINSKRQCQKFKIIKDFRKPLYPSKPVQRQLHCRDQYYPKT